jgi:hypothetical protein
LCGSTEESRGDRRATPTGARRGSTLDVTSPADLNFSCPGGQTLTLVSVFYTNVTVTDQTSGVSASLADQSYVNPLAP